MNIFYLHQEPVVAANYLHDKHVVKMILESAQILCTVYARYGQSAPYKPTHQNHPSVVWAGDTVQQYQWLFRHAWELCNVYRRTYGRTHACEAVLRGLERPPAGLHRAGWVQPPQCMPEEFHTPGDSVAAYRKYYLARKVVQSRWTRRDVPPFVLGESNMATAKKTVPSKTAPTSKKAAPAPAPAPVEAEEQAVPRSRGPRGVSESAVIRLKVQGNPKREGSKAHAVFSHYEDGQTIAEFCAALEATDPEMVKEATPNLVYDAKHGFIEIEGYTPPGGVVVKEPKPAKEPKAAKTGKSAKKAAEQSEAEAEVESVAQEEVID